MKNIGTSSIDIPCNLQEGRMKSEDHLSSKFRGMALICSGLVVMIHVPHVSDHGVAFWWFNQFIADGVCRIAVPFFFFFFSSGFFLAKHFGEQMWWKTEIAKRFRSLCIPFLAWNLIFFGITSCSSICANIAANRFVFSGLSLDLIYLFGLRLCDQPMLMPTWYLRALFLLVVISGLLSRLCANRRILWLTLFCIACLYMLICPWPDSQGSFLNIFRYTFSLEGLFYFYVGVICRCYKKPIPFNINSSILCVILGLALIVISAVMRYENAPFDIHCRCCGIFFLFFGIWCLFPSCHLSDKWSGLSFPIYLIHPVILFLISTLYRNFAKVGICGYAIGVFVVVGLSILSIIALRHYCPRITAFLLGGR